MLDPNYWYSITEIHYFLEREGHAFHRKTIYNWIKYYGAYGMNYKMPKGKILVKGDSFNDFFYA